MRSLCGEEAVRVVSDGTPAIPHDWNLAGRPTVLHLGHPGTLILSVADPTEIGNQAGTGRPGAAVLDIIMQRSARGIFILPAAVSES